jgi:hypothetical protein
MRYAVNPHSTADRHELTSERTTTPLQSAGRRGAQRQGSLCRCERHTGVGHRHGQQHCQAARLEVRTYAIRVILDLNQRLTIVLMWRDRSRAARTSDCRRGTTCSNARSSTSSAPWPAPMTSASSPGALLPKASSQAR